MFNVVLVAPEIPPNTGNVIRLCANTGAHLHLVQPLGFSLDDKQLRRAGLDYHEYASLRVHANFDVALEPGDWFFFGAETSGLPHEVRSWFAPGHDLRLPMRPDNRSLNLSNAVAVVVYEAWRQAGFRGGA
jgi:tRNA (cytidine/uridine-2'-O-)-methyltransferase